MTVAEVIGTSLSGIPYNGPDIGGFSGDPTAELYLRWFQMAALLPFFRTHSALTTSRREPWLFGEAYTSIIRQFLALRYRLLPYIYTLAWQASQRGQPLVKPLFWHHPGRSELWDVDDAFLLGDVLLVAPVVEPGQAQRAVTLPPGGWYNFWDDQFFQGPGEAEMETPLERLPVWVCAGCLLPTEAEGQLTLHLYAPPAARSAKDLPAYDAGLLYSDAGDGYGDWRVDRFYVALQAGQVWINRQSEGQYPHPDSEIILQLHGAQAKQGWVDGRPLTVENNRLTCGMFDQIKIGL
jgi:alpha-glucosidase